MAAEIDRSGSPDGRLALAYSLVDDKGRLIHSQIDRAVKTPVSPETAIQRYSGFILSDATGAHTLKIAVVDERGRRGSVEHSFRAALTAVGQVRATDLLIADDRTTSGSAAPIVGRRVHVGHGQRLHRALLRRGRRPEEHDGDVRGRAGCAGDERSTAPPVECSRRPPTRRTGERSKGPIPLALLPPGDYVVRAVVSTDGRKAGQVTRPFRVGRTIAASKAKPPTGPRLARGKPGDRHPHVTHRTLRPRVGPHAAGGWLLCREAERWGTRRTEPGTRHRACARRPLRRSRPGAQHAARHPCRQPF